MSRNTKSLSSAAKGVQAVLKSSDLLQALRPHLAKVRWAEVVGPQVAAVTQVEKVQGTELVVRVKNSVWANELCLLKGDMLRRLNLALGGQVLTDIRFKAGGLAREKISVKTPISQFPPGAETLARSPLSPAVQQRIDAVTCTITDDALRSRVRLSLLRAARVDAWKQNHQWQPCPRCCTLLPPSSASSGCPFCQVVPLSSLMA